MFAKFTEPICAAASHALVDSGVDVLHGHSAHIFQGVEVYKNRLIIYDSGDFVDDYYVDPILRNDRTFFFIVTLSKSGPLELQLIPCLIENLQVSKATFRERKEIISRMQMLSQELGTKLSENELGLHVRCKPA